MARMNLTPVPSDSPACANCSAPLVSDQRYCLACGHPVSPVRLAFLDVLQSEHQSQGAAGPLAASPVAYAPLYEPPSTPAWLRRYSPLFGVLSVLLMAMIIGLLVGHWVTQNKAAPSQQVLKVEGLSGSALAPAAASPSTPTATTPASTTPSAAGKSSAKAEAEEVSKEAKAEKTQAAKVEHAKVVKPSTTTLKKLGSSTGKKHEEEVNALGAQPIETGG